MTMQVSDRLEELKITDLVFSCQKPEDYDHGEWCQAW